MNNDMEKFFTRATANEGKKLPLRHPDGTPSEHYLIIRSQWSDEFIQANDDAMRSLAVKVAAKDADAKSVFQEQKLSLIAACIAGWSFSTEFTHENVIEFLRNAPQIAKQVNKLAGDDKYFFKKESASS